MHAFSLATGRKLYLLDPAGLLAGDILLESGTGFTSAAIRYVDGGNFSHALMWLGGNQLIEAVDCGARLISYTRVIIENPTSWKLLRFTGDAATAAKAAAEARNLAHKRYDTIGAISTTRWRIRSRPDVTMLFCSQLVAESYSRAGIALVEGAEPHKVSPAMLEKCARLTALAVPLTEIASDKLGEAVAVLKRDKVYSGSPMDRELLAVQEAFDAVQARASALTPPQGSGVRMPPGNLSDLLDLLQVTEGAEADSVADSLLTELEKRGYFKLFVEPYIGLKFGLDGLVQRQRAGTLDADEIKEFRDWYAVAGLTDTRDQFRRNGQACLQAYAQTKRKLWLKLSSMYHMNAEGVDLLIQSAAEITVPE